MSIETQAVVTLTVAVKTRPNSWDDKCHIAQAFKEAQHEAVNRLGELIKTDARISVVRVDSVAVLSEQRR